MKQLTGVHGAPPPHWVGDGFPVRSLFSYHRFARELSPFLLLDYAGPADFQPAARPRGVGAHPHRGFETVTIVYDGEVSHRDSTGAGGRIGPGDVQWMTAAAGILHEEFHSPEFTRRGGRLEMVQLWVNLPAKDKLSPPGYQTLLDAQIPRVSLPDGAGALRVIAGRFAGEVGPARTFTPIQVWDLRLTGEAPVRLDVPEGNIAAVVVLDGRVRIGDGAEVGSAQFGLLGRDGRDILLTAQGPAKLLVLAGEPIEEPVVGSGPFVMNTEAEIRAAFADFNAGRF
jgi:hypothetical protein